MPTGVYPRTDKHRAANRVHRTHNLSYSRTYKSWQMMRTRCTNPNSPDYHRYGGRGITVCERWRSFENFYADMGERPVDTSLDRCDGNGNYEPLNCRWATRLEQNVNTTRSLGYKTLDDERVSMREMAARLAISEKALYYLMRLKPKGKGRAA